MKISRSKVKRHTTTRDSKLKLFWEKQAESFVWQKRWKSVLTGKFEKGEARWFIGARTNITENCLDRHIQKHGKDVAILWEPNNPKDKSISLTYQQLYEEVCRMANVLKKYGVKKGDGVCIYMPMIPEAVVAMLACARIGAVHNVVFAGFSATSLAERMNDSGCRVVVTSDIGYRGEKEVRIKANVEEAVRMCSKVKHVLVFFRHTKHGACEKNEVDVGRELALTSSECRPVPVRAEDSLFVLYTSGSTGKPKGIVHAVGGYMVYAGYTFKKVFGYRPGEIFWCTADLGWITGHTYSVYGPLLNRATILLFEGIPTHPTPSRYWQIIEKHKVNIFYTAPTVIRSLASYGTRFVEKFTLRSLRLIGSVGEPLNAEAWKWYHRFVGKKKCRIVDTWWQTETGGIMISPQARVKSFPGSVGLPMPMIEVRLLNAKGGEIKTSKEFGSLCIKKPWPGMSIGILNNKKRFVRTYFSACKGYYTSGDVAQKDERGQYYVFGRSDDVMNVSGHRLGSAEVESAINTHPDAIESSVVARPHSITGSEMCAFVILQHKRADEDEVCSEIITLVRRTIGPIATLGRVYIVNNLPKTRSGKIVRRILRRLANGDSCDSEDVTTLVDQGVIEELRMNLRHTA